MEALFTAFTLTLTPPVVFSMVGGFIGAWIASDRKNNGWQLSLLFMIVAVIASAALGEYLVSERGIKSIWLLCILNVPWGMIS